MTTMEARCRQTLTLVSEIMAAMGIELPELLQGDLMRPPPIKVPFCTTCFVETGHAAVPQLSCVPRPGMALRYLSESNIPAQRIESVLSSPALYWDADLHVVRYVGDDGAARQFTGSVDVCAWENMK